MGKGGGTLPEIRGAEQGYENSWNSLINEFTFLVNCPIHEGELKRNRLVFFDQFPYGGSRPNQPDQNERRE